MIRYIIATTKSLGYSSEDLMLYAGIPCWLGLKTSYCRLAVCRSMHVHDIQNILYMAGVNTNVQRVESVPIAGKCDIQFDCISNDIRLYRTAFGKDSSALHLCVEPPIRRCIRKFVNRLFPNLMPDYSIHFSKCIAFGKNKDIDEFIELLSKSSKQFEHQVITIID